MQHQALAGREKANRARATLGSFFFLFMSLGFVLFLTVNLEPSLEPREDTRDLIQFPTTSRVCSQEQSPPVAPRRALVPGTVPGTQ